MGMVLARLSGLAVTVALTACVSTSIQTPAYKAGEMVEGAITLYGRTYPLEQGNWVVAAVNETKSRVDGQINSAGTQSLELVLFQTNERIIAKTVWISGNIETQGQGVAGYVYDRQCERNDVLKVNKIYNVQGGAQDCYMINHYTTVNNDSSDILRLVNSFTNQSKLSVPKNLIMVRYRFADRQDNITVTYGFNPELEGFPREADSRWEGSGWHQKRIAQDTKRVEYIKKIEGWAEAMYPKVRAAFKQEWVYRPAALRPQPAPATSSQNDEIAQKLKSLQNLREGGLITQHEYDTQKARLLDQM